MPADDDDDDDDDNGMMIRMVDICILKSLQYVSRTSYAHHFHLPNPKLSNSSNYLMPVGEMKLLSEPFCLTRKNHDHALHAVYLQVSLLTGISIRIDQDFINANE